MLAGSGGTALVPQLLRRLRQGNQKLKTAWVAERVQGPPRQLSKDPVPKFKKYKKGPGMVAHAFHPCPLEAGAGR